MIRGRKGANVTVNKVSSHRSDSRRDSGRDGPNRHFSFVGKRSKNVTFEHVSRPHVCTFFDSRNEKLDSAVFNAPVLGKHKAKCHIAPSTATLTTKGFVSVLFLRPNFVQQRKKKKTTPIRFALRNATYHHSLRTHMWHILVTRWTSLYGCQFLKRERERLTERERGDKQEQHKGKMPF